MPLAEISAALSALITQPGLAAEANFARRIEVLDELEVHVLDRLSELADEESAATLRKQAVAFQAQLEALNQQLYARLREEIRSGRCREADLRQRLLTYAGPTPAGAATSYDTLDVLTDGLFPEPAEFLVEAAREPEMVYYQKTPARIILELAAHLTPTDVFYDLGSGLGQVPILVGLLSGAEVKGVEIEPAYCRYAEISAAALGLTRGQFPCADARHVDYADGTVFYMFTPFTGRIMAQVLAQLRQRAQHRPLRIFSYGPSTEALSPQLWLQRQDAPARHLYQLAEFRSCETGMNS